MRTPQSAHTDTLAVSADRSQYADTSTPGSGPPAGGYITSDIKYNRSSVGTYTLRHHQYGTRARWDAKIRLQSGWRSRIHAILVCLFRGCRTRPEVLYCHVIMHRWVLVKTCILRLTWYLHDEMPELLGRLVLLEPMPCV